MRKSETDSTKGDQPVNLFLQECVNELTLDLLT